MKTTSLVANQGLACHSFGFSAKSMAVVLFLSFALFACKDDNESISPYVGTYSVVETDEDSNVENYTVKISSTSAGFEISNFGDLLKVPVKATITGKTLTIPTQTFVGTSTTINISGQGSFNDNGVLTFNYVIDFGDNDISNYSCVSTKQP